jgi:hypothetical protein
MIPHWIMKAMCFFASIRAVPKPGLTQRHRQRVPRLACVVALGAAVYSSMLSPLGFRLRDDALPFVRDQSCRSRRAACWYHRAQPNEA